MRAVSSWAVAGGATSSANTSSAPVIWAVSATAIPSSSRKPMPSARVGTPRARATPSSTEANSSGRPARRQQQDRHRGDRQQRQHLSRGDAQEAAEQQALVAAEHPLVEAQEQEPAGQPERLDRARHGGLLAAVAAPLAGGGRRRSRAPRARRTRRSPPTPRARGAAPRRRRGRPSPTACGRRTSGGAGP